MKKFALVTMVLSFMMMGTIYAQQNNTTNRPVTQYIKDQVAPSVKQAQQKFIKSLTKNEKAELAQLQAELQAFRADAKKNQMNKQGNFNQQKWVERQQALKDIMDKAEKIVAAHPKSAKAYTDFINENAPKWEAEIAKLRPNNRGYAANRPMNNRSQFLFQKLSEPAFGLIVNADNLGNFNRPMMGNRPGMMQPNNRRGYGNLQGNWGGQRSNWNNGNCGQRRGNMQGRRGMNRGNRAFGQRGSRFMAMQNPEMKAKMLAYAKENIFPAISKERNAFDKYLSGSEKRTIEKARVQIAELQKERIANFQQGRRGFRGQPDSSRLALRLKMDEAMLPVKQIALKHFSELKSVADNLKQEAQEWRLGMRKELAQGMPAGRGQQFQGRRGMRQGMRQGRPGMNQRQGRPGFNQRPGMQNMSMFGPVKFLLYNPESPEASMPMMQQASSTN